MRKRLRLALYAAVLLLIGGAVTGFAAFNKTITISEDGHARQVRTFASTVGSALDRAGVQVGPHDIVAPARSVGVHDGSEIVVRHGRLLTLIIDGKTRKVWTTATDVDEALGVLGVRAQGALLSVSRDKRIPLSGLEISIGLVHHVTVVHDGTSTVADSNAITVGQLLEQQNIPLGPLDQVSPAVATRPADGMTVTITRIATGQVTEQTPIPFATQRVADASLYKGTEKVVQAGSNGVLASTYAIRSVDGVVVEKNLIGQQQLAAPVDRVVHYGTKPKPAPSYPRTSASGLNWGALARCESGGNPQAGGHSGPYYGLYQFTLGTWASVGGSGYPSDAASSEQTYRAQILYGREGTSPWPTCGRYLYS